MGTQDDDNEAHKLKSFEDGVMADLLDDDDQQADEGDEGDTATDDASSEQATKAKDEGKEADAGKDGDESSGGAKTEPPEDEPTDKRERGALRAARRAERLSRQRADRAEQELAELRKTAGLPAQGKDTEDDDDALVIADLEEDQPEVARRLRAKSEQTARLKAELEALKASSGAKAKDDDEDTFVPETLPDELQAQVDENRALQDMQYDPDQARWQFAKRVDGLLTAHPRWKSVPVAERLAEVVRRVKAELSDSQEAPNPKAKPTPARRAAPVEEDDDAPETLTGLRGGEPGRTSAHNFSRMTDDQVMASLRE